MRAKKGERSQLAMLVQMIPKNYNDRNWKEGKSELQFALLAGELFSKNIMMGIGGR